MNHATRPRPGFTIIETTITITIIAMLAGVLLLAVNKAVRTARLAAEREVVRSLSTAVVKYREDFRVLPPLIDDHLDGNGNTTGSVIDGQGRPDVRNEMFLSSEINPDDPRHSIYALSWYLMGSLDELRPNPEAANAPMPLDGAAGPKMTEPLAATGTFKRKGRVYDALYDPTRAGPKHEFGRYPVGAAEEARIALTDRWGQPIRYYRWKSQYGASGNVSQYLVPRSVGDPTANPELRGAEFAVVSLGADGRTQTAANGFDLRPLPTGGIITAAVDNTPLDDSVKDNIVEVGR